MLKNKKSFVNYIEEEEEDSVFALTKYCEWKNCEKKGEYKAPTSRSELRVFKWFCLEHIKIYNKGWDYFKGRTMDEIYNEVSSDSTWHRPTWIRVKNHNFDDIHNICIDENKSFNNFNEKNYSKNEKSKIEEALNILNLTMPFKITDLKKQYKKMVKKFHPDVCKNTNEEYIISLNHAYTELLKFLKQ